MYNEDQKNAYLSVLKDELKSSVSSMFKASARYEVSADKDISEFSAYEFIQFIKSETKLFSTQKSWYEIYTDYVSWAIKSELTNQCEFPQPAKYNRHKPTKSVSNTGNMIASPRHLQKVLDSVYPEINTMDYNDNTISIARRSLYWLLFSGISEDDICKITKEHIIFEKRRIILNGVTYPMYEESVTSLEAACFATGLKYEHPNYKTIITRTTTSDSILRGIRDYSEKYFATQKTETIKDFKRKNVPYLIFDYVWKSGIFYRMYEEETSGQNLEILLKESGRLFGIPALASSNSRRDLSQRYETWKSKYKRI